MYLVRRGWPRARGFGVGYWKEHAYSQDAMSQPTADAAADAPSSYKPPHFGVVLGGHLVFILLYAILNANNFWLIPMLVRLRFGAADPDVRDWQTTLVTAAIPTLMMGSIFWAEVLRRVSLRRYLILYWLVGAFPWGCIAFVQSYWQLLGLHIIACAGWAGWVPVQGRLLKHFYSDAIRGRVFAVLNVVNLASGVIAIFVVGRWIGADPEAFRIYYPLAVLLQLFGVGTLIWLAWRTRADVQIDAEPSRSWKTLARPILHMGEILRSDRTFLRYEAAFMTYGAAFMFCDALLPVLATTELGMQYEDYAHSTYMVVRGAMLTLVFPMGWLMDRIGPIRTSGIAFGMLTLYPLVLLLAEGPSMLAVACAVHGAGQAGVMMGWMLGPVALAPTPEKVPHYSGVHATLVGIRGVVCQGLGMWLYKVSGGFLLPLLLASGLMAGASIQMFLLRRTLRRRLAHAEPPGNNTTVNTVNSYTKTR